MIKMTPEQMANMVVLDGGYHKALLGNSILAVTIFEVFPFLREDEELFEAFMVNVEKWNSENKRTVLF